jgi:hypothetical protein
MPPLTRAEEAGFERLFEALLAREICGRSGL